MGKSKLYEVKIINKNGESKKFRARIIGVIDTAEANAVINTDGAPKKLFTSESIDPNEIYSVAQGNRVVFATSDYKSSCRHIIISPVVLYSIKHFMGRNTYIGVKTKGQMEFRICTESYI